MSQKRKK